MGLRAATWGEKNFETNHIMCDSKVLYLPTVRAILQAIEI